jgi:hypothetical protein
MGDSNNEVLSNTNESEIRRRNVSKDSQIGDLINLNDDTQNSAHSISDPSKSGQDTADSDHVSFSRKNFQLFVIDFFHFLENYTNWILFFFFKFLQQNLSFL